MPHVAGIILCGGTSTRMGRPKCWLPIGDEVMLPRIVRLMSEVVAPIVVVAAPGQDLPPLPQGVILTHDPAPGRGPLQGMVAGLAALPDETDAAYVSSCDVPLLLPTFVRRMIELLGQSDAVVPRISGILHPLAAVYRRDARTVAEQLLKSGQNRLTDFCIAIRARIVGLDELTSADLDLQSLQNLNTPEDYSAAIRQLSR